MLFEMGENSDSYEYNMVVYKNTNRMDRKVEWRWKTKKKNKDNGLERWCHHQMNE